ncbi:MAG: adenosylhomocysteinase [Thaumarchaeota archaeon]|nr:adenosylhomocysteinase [Nitrososphaerota archaeon]
MPSKIADPSLAGKGELSYKWAYNHMPTLTAIIEREAPKKPLAGRRVGVCLHVTKETSVLVMGLKRLGAEVYLAAANPLSTQDDIAAYLASQGINVFAWRGEKPSEYFDCIHRVLSSRVEFLMDDGSDAHVEAHKMGGLNILAGTEETTTGVIRLRALEKDGLLKYPVVAVNNAYTKYLFDNRYGTGQSVIDGILRATSLLLAGKTVVVCGYGWVGKGVAKRARGLDAHVIVTEVDPLKALEAHMDGYTVMPIAKAAEVGDIFITVTGQTGVIRGEHIERMKDGAILANGGHFDVEIDVKYLDENAASRVEVRPYTEEYRLKSGKRVYLIGRGRIANLVAAEGHPPEVMMMSFSNQLLSLIYLTQNHSKMQPKVYDVPQSIDQEVARRTIEALGIEIDEMTEEQKKYAQSWLL